MLDLCRLEMRDLHPPPMAAAAPGQSSDSGLQQQQIPLRRCMKRSASAATLLGGGAVAASRYLLQEELGRGASGQVKGLGELKSRETTTLAAKEEFGRNACPVTSLCTAQPKLAFLDIPLISEEKKIYLLLLSVEERRTKGRGEFNCEFECLLPPTLF